MRMARHFLPLISILAIFLVVGMGRAQSAAARHTFTTVDESVALQSNQYLYRNQWFPAQVNQIDTNGGRVSYVSNRAEEIQLELYIEIVDGRQPVNYTQRLIRMRTSSNNAPVLRMYIQSTSEYTACSGNTTSRINTIYRNLKNNSTNTVGLLNDFLFVERVLNITSEERCYSKLDREYNGLRYRLIQRLSALGVTIS